MGKAWVSALFVRWRAVSIIIRGVFLRCSQLSGMLYLSPNKTCMFLIGLALFLETILLIDAEDKQKLKQYMPGNINEILALGREDCKICSLWGSNVAIKSLTPSC